MSVWAILMSVLGRKSEPSPDAVAIIRLLENDAEAWRADRYNLKIWISHLEARGMDWALEVSLPGHGTVVAQGDGCRASRDHRAIASAARRHLSGQRRDGSLIRDYVSKAEIETEKRWLARRAELFAADHQSIKDKLSEQSA